MTVDRTSIVSYDTTMNDTITQAEYRAFQRAYDFFNAELFGGSLPNVLVTLQRHARAYGYFSPERFVARAGKEAAHELALNPDHFGRTDELILSTLVHEMAHVWQKAHGKMPRRGYHDRQWAAKMKEIGLHPSHNAEPGGKETGQQMSHYIVAGGHFSAAFAKLKAKGFTLRWQLLSVRSASVRLRERSEVNSRSFAPSLPCSLSVSRIAAVTWRIPDVKDNYKGYARLNCLPPPGLVSLRGGRILPKQQRDNLNPVAMVLTGTPGDGALRFTLDKTVVAPNDDCETTEFELTPFGTNQVALEWHEGLCRGTQLILNKNGR